MKHEIGLVLEEKRGYMSLFSFKNIIRSLRSQEIFLDAASSLGLKSITVLFFKQKLARIQ